MKLRWIVMSLALATATVVTPAAIAGKYGKQVRFAGVHPVPKSEGGGMCHIEGPHVHVYTANKLEYRVVEDNNVFVGDPMAYGWDGDKHAYKGHHPVQVNVVGEVGAPTVHYCYLNGPHYHSFEPASDADYKIVGDAYFYVGTPAPLYMEARPTYIGINTTYEPIVYTRPVVTVEPPTGWILLRPGFVVEAAPAAVIVSGPPGQVKKGYGAVGVGVGVGVSVPVPSISVGVGVHVGGPAVIVAPGGRGKFKHKKFKRH